MDLRQLKHLLAVLDQGSFAKAAIFLHLSQPALSRSIDRLEEELGAILLDRQYGNTRATPFGAKIADRARRIIDETKEFKRDLAQTQLIDSGRLRIGFGPFAAALFMQQVVADMVASYPRLRLDVFTDAVVNLTDRLREDKIDLIVGDARAVGQAAGFEVIGLKNVAVRFVVRKEHPLASELVIPSKDLMRYPIAAPRIPVGMSTATADLRISITCDDMSAVRKLVLSTNTIAISPAEVFAEDARRRTTTLLKLADEDPLSHLFTEFAIVTATGRTLSTASLAAIERLREMVPN
jgi:DNA-binding transcriptional LysR family regulator